jgi:hypothetical protein
MENEAATFLTAYRSLLTQALRVYMETCSTKAEDLESKDMFGEADYYRKQYERTDKLRDDLIEVCARFQQGRSS